MNSLRRRNWTSSLLRCGLAAAAWAGRAQSASACALKTKMEGPVLTGVANVVELPVLSREWMTPDMLRLRLRLPGRLLGLPAGGHVMVHAGDADGDVRRPYTPVSELDDCDTLQLAVKVYPKGPFVAARAGMGTAGNAPAEYPGGRLGSLLAAKKVGDKVGVSGPLAMKLFDGAGFRWGLPRDPAMPTGATRLLCIGAGSGATPAFQIARAATVPATLVLVNRSRAETPLQDEVRALQARKADLTVHYIVTQEDTEEPGFTSGKPADALPKLLADLPKDAIAVLSGPQSFMHEACTPLLLNAGLPEDRLVYY